MKDQLACLLLLVCVGSGCIIRLEVGGEAQGGPSGDEPLLPDPVGQPGDETVLDAAQQARKEEAERYTAEVIYKGGTILKSVQMPSGEVLDFIDRNTLTALPYALPALPFGPEDFVLPEGLSLGFSELEQIPELLELAVAATPFHRPGFWPYILGEAPDATSVEDYLQRYTEGGAPSSKRLYAGLQSNEPNRGISGYMSQFRPEVASDSFSLLEFSVFCPAEGDAQELVGIVISVDRFNVFGTNRQKHQDGEARMHIEYARMVNGKTTYVWDGMDGTFVDNPFRLHQPGEIVPVSVLNQTSVEHLMAVFQVPTGDWWIAYNGDLLGYYPAKLFSKLNKSACGSAWYGEAFVKNPAKTLKPEMGSGKFAEAGLFNAAHVRNPKYYDLIWLAHEPKDEFSLVPKEAQCYSRSSLIHLGPPWDSTFLFIGGPGEKNPACIWP